MKSFKQYLEEKLIIAGKGKKTGQVILLAGGSGSGKSFAINKFIHSKGYTVLNADDIITQGIALANMGNEDFAELKDLDITKPDDLQKAYNWVHRKKKLSNKKIDLFLSSATKSRLPNIIVDATFAWKGQFKRWSERLLEFGYKSEDIHVIWVLTEESVAITQNEKRKEAGDRYVPEDVIIRTAKGSKMSMRALVFKKAGPLIKGEIYVIFGGPENTVFWADKDGNPIENRGGKIIKNFKYLKIKEAGKKVDGRTKIAKKFAKLVDLHKEK